MGEHNRQVPRVLVAWIHPGQVSGRFMTSVLDLFREDAFKQRSRQRFIPTGYLAVETGPRIASARNKVVQAFLGRDVEWLLMIDTDMVFKTSDVEHLLSAADPVERPIVGGLCFGGGHGSVHPTMYEFIEPDKNDGDVVRKITEWEEGSLVKVDGTGAAFLLVHRSALIKIGEVYGGTPYPWFSEGAVHDHEFGEDWMFCLRAMRLGIPIYVDTAAAIGHMKATMLTEEVWRSGSSSLVSEGIPEPMRELEAV